MGDLGDLIDKGLERGLARLEACDNERFSEPYQFGQAIVTASMPPEVRGSSITCVMSVWFWRVQTYRLPGLMGSGKGEAIRSS